jgi:type I restriction enzyme S subunit
MLPDGWVKSTLGDQLVKIVGGGTPNRKITEYWTGHIPWATVKDLLEGHISGTEEYISEHGLKNSAANLIPAETIIVATRMAVGRIVRFPMDVAINQDLKALFPKPSVDKVFLAHWLESKRPFLESQSSGSTVAGIRLEVLHGLSILLPPLDEQTRIAEIITTLGASISTTHAVIKQMRAVTCAFMKSIFGNSSWKMKSIGQLCECIVPGRNKPKSFTGDIPWITTPDITKSHVAESLSGLAITAAEARSTGNRIVPRNSVIMSCVGDLGLVAINDVDLVINQQLHAFIPNSSIDADFLRYALLYQKPYMEKMATKTSIPYLNKTNCNSTPIPHIDVDLQRSVIRPLKLLEEREAHELLHLQHLLSLRAALVPDMLSGELRFPTFTRQHNGEVVYG